jgi:hypothetical protein
LIKTIVVVGVLDTVAYEQLNVLMVVKTIVVVCTLDTLAQK